MDLVLHPFLNFISQQNRVWRSAEYYWNLVTCIYRYLSIAAFSTYFVAVNIYVKCDIITSFDSIIKNLTLTDALVPYIEKYHESY